MSQVTPIFDTAIDTINDLLKVDSIYTFWFPKVV